ncbi:hypothetical protein [Acetobacterium sp.]|uniref:hypothetical protein n=1 Tax=Acetobacterium sp. TaxID=1872094 RepID=UPI0035936D6E
MGKRLVGNLKMSILIMMCLIMILSLSACAKVEAKKDFDALSTEISQLQDSISNRIAEGQTLLTDTKTEELADPSLLEALKKEIDSSKADTVNVPTVGTATDEIKQQIEELAGKKEELESRLHSLNSSITAIGDSKQKLVEQIAAEKEAKLNEAISPNSTYSIIATDDNGNKEKITVRIGQWLKGSETEMLDKAWQNVGGESTMPLTGAYEGDEFKNGGTFHPKEAAYVFGSVTIENLTPDFSPENFCRGSSGVSLIPEIGTGSVVQGREYTSGTSCDIVGGFNYVVNAKMTSNNWGPVPFVIGVENVFSPNYPDGNPQINEVEFSLNGSISTHTQGDEKFIVKKSW